MMFDDRTVAGEQLGARLRADGVPADIVLAIPRGGLPVGRAVADTLDVPLDIVVAKKIGAPHNPELAIGAAAADGSVYRNEDILRRLDVSDGYLDEAREEAAAAARDKAERYRAGRDEPGLAGRDVVVVDDGVATGATMTACLRQVRAADAASVTCAVPVGPPDTLDALEREADRVVALDRPRGFRAVGQYYRDFAQVQDEEAMAYLD